MGSAHKSKTICAVLPRKENGVMKRPTVGGDDICIDVDDGEANLSSTLVRGHMRTAFGNGTSGAGDGDLTTLQKMCGSNVTDYLATHKAAIMPELMRNEKHCKILHPQV